MLCLFTSLLYTPQIVPKTLSGGTEPNYNLPETIKPSPESFTEPSLEMFLLMNSGYAKSFHTITYTKNTEI